MSAKSVIAVTDDSTISTCVQGRNNIVLSSSPEAVISEVPCRGSSSSIQVQPSDVLLGRGKSIHAHPGNVVYRNDIKERSRPYKKEVDQVAKQEIAQEVIQTVLGRGGRFLRPVDDTGNWEECPETVVRTKVKQALRDILKERPSVDARRSLKSSASAVRGTRSPLLWRLERTCPPAAAPAPNPGRSQASTAFSQPSRINGLSSFLAPSHRPVTDVTSGHISGAAAVSRQDLPAALLRHQQASATLPSLAQLNSSLLAAAAGATRVGSSGVGPIAPNVPQMGTTNYPLLQSYAALLRTQQQPQFPGVLSHMSPHELEDLVRRLRQGG